MGVATMANKKMLFVTFVDSAKQFETHSSQFSLISTDWLHLRVAQIPRCRDLVVFVVTTTTDRQTDYFIPGHARSPVHACIIISVVCNDCFLYVQPLAELSVQERDIHLLNNSEYSTLGTLFNDSIVSKRMVFYLL